jgi:CheY-like chemotaxis protein
MGEPFVWRVLVVDDDGDICRQLEESLGQLQLESGDTFKPYVVKDFTRALQLIEERRFDILILDVFKGQVGEGGSLRGREVLDEVKQRQFLPVIFYTALPRSVEDLKDPVVDVVAKESGFGALQTAIEKFMQSGLPQINRAFAEHSAKVFCEYLWEFLPKHWESVFADGEPVQLAYILCRRLANSLDGRGAERLAGAIMGREPPEATENTGDKAHPMQFYILPPLVDGTSRAGDIVKDRDDGTYWMVLTPTCDFAHDKAKFVLLAYGVPLTERDEYKEWQGNQADARATEKLKGLLASNPQKGQKDRFWFLPGAAQLPPLVIDLQQTKAVPIAGFRNIEKIATLDSPFAEALIQRYSKFFFGRVGCPDLDTDAVIEELSKGVSKTE